MLILFSTANSSEKGIALIVFIISLLLIIFSAIKIGKQATAGNIIALVTGVIFSILSLIVLMS